jgi:hypothetical protein
MARSSWRGWGRGRLLWSRASTSLPQTGRNRGSTGDAQPSGSLRAAPEAPPGQYRGREGSAVPEGPDPAPSLDGLTDRQWAWNHPLDGRRVLRDPYFLAERTRPLSESSGGLRPRPEMMKMARSRFCLTPPRCEVSRQRCEVSRCFPFPFHGEGAGGEVYAFGTITSRRCRVRPEKLCREMVTAARLRGARRDWRIWCTEG